jgi:hypothetical protein
MRLASLLGVVRSLLAQGRAVSPAVLATIGRGVETTRRYPEWHSARKIRGRHDASLVLRSNRRKGARKAAAR